MTVNVPNYGFPAGYDENYLILLVRDPRCIFAYWEFSEAQMVLVAKEFCCQWGQVPLMLRIYDLTGLNFKPEKEHSHFEISVHPLSNNYYINDVLSNHSYCADIGVMTPDGQFITLNRSNVVQTPRDSMADGSGTFMADLLDHLPVHNPEEDKEKQKKQEKRDSFQKSCSSDGVYLNTSGE